MLSNKPTLSLYVGFPDQLIPSDIKNQRLQPFLPPPGKGANPGPPRGSKKSENTFKQPEGDPIRAPGHPQCTKDQKDIRIIEPLKFFYELC